MKLGFVFMLVMVALTFSYCSKGNTAKNNTPPENLVVNAIVSTDNSGNVAFTASATNATNYEFDFGNGEFKLVASGNIVYKYAASGVYTVNIIAKSASGLTTSKSIQVTVLVNLSLIWSDEFETSGAPDAAKWGYDIGTGSGGWGNNELQYYTNRSTNAIVSNGTLKIIAQKENFGGSSYTSARLLSKGKFSTKYGKIEARAKLPAGGGTWPAIWMLGDNIGTVGWPACGEIDIMEHKGNDPNKIYGTVHHPGHSGGNADGGTKVISNATSEFHIYTVEWSASSIKFLVDGIAYYTFANNSSLPFNQNFFLLLNVAMGGTFGGSVNPTFSSAAMEIDYVRVYQ